jgi:hypothetical protein
MRKMSTALTVGLLVLFVAGASSSAAEWGSLKGRFVVDGTPVKAAPIQITKDPEYCGKQEPVVDETVVVGKDNALVNGVVYLRAPFGKKIDINPAYEAKLKKPVVLDNHFCAFHPHITLLRVGQPLTIKNSDPPPIGHNTKIDLFSFNQTIGSNSQLEITDSKEFALPVPIACSMHPWMQGHLLSLNHPYMAASGADGTFEIKDMPAGTNEFQFWHEARGYMKDLKFKGGSTNAQGRAKLTIAAGQTLDLGDIKVPARMLAPK